MVIIELNLFPIKKLYYLLIFFVFMLQNTTVVVYNVNEVKKLKNIDGDNLREIVRIIVRNLGLLERGNACCCGVTLAQCHAIVEIGRAKEITLNILAELLNVDKSTISRTIDNLVSLNYVTRETHSENRRYIKISLSKNGEEIYEKIEESMSEYYNNLISLVAEDKKETVHEALAVLMDVIKQNKGSNTKGV